MEVLNKIIQTPEFYQTQLLSNAAILYSPCIL